MIYRRKENSEKEKLNNENLKFKVVANFYITISVKTAERSNTKNIQYSIVNSQLQRRS